MDTLNNTRKRSAIMMSSERNWKTIHQCVMINKEKEERERQATSSTPNPHDLGETRCVGGKG